MRTFRIFLLLAVASVIAIHAETSAQKVMRDACLQASKEKKVVFIDFGSPG